MTMEIDGSNLFETSGGSDRAGLLCGGSFRWHKGKRGMARPAGDANTGICTSECDRSRQV